MEVDDIGDIVFRIEAALLPRLNAWIKSVDEKVAREQVRTGESINGVPLAEGALRMVRDSLDRDIPQPHYGAIGGAYRYSFSPTALGCVIKVTHAETGDEIDLSDYDRW